MSLDLVDRLPAHSGGVTQASIWGRFMGGPTPSSHEDWTP